MRISADLASHCRKTPERSAWLERLPSVAAKLQQEWALTIEDEVLAGEPGECAYVAGVLFRNGARAVLKIGMPHMEAEHEAEGLRFWNGEPTVRLLGSDDAAGAMLLERCVPGTPLRSLTEEQQDEVIASLLRRLWRMPAAPHPFRPLSAMLACWEQETLSQSSDWPDEGLVRAGLKLLRDLPKSAEREVLLATDVHAGNVLSAKREPWRVIDPKPFVGDPAYDVTQHLFNCRARLRSDPGGTIRRFADLAGIDYERARLWTFARAAAQPRGDWRNSELARVARSIAA
jgi:streptomycin 6-kinase